MRIEGNGKVGIGTVTSPAQKLEVNGSIRQKVMSQSVSIPAKGTYSFSWNHNLGYQPVIMLSLDQTGGDYCDFVGVSYAHDDNNNITIYLSNRSSNDASGTVNWIVVY
jgi:hypothetical protein